MQPMKKLVKEYKIMARKEKVYEALTEPFNISQWSGDEAVMQLEKGGYFSLWAGSIHGENLEMSPSRIVQNWKERDWENYSTVVFNLSEENGITILEMVHSDIPQRSYDSIDEGWDKYYLGPLKAFIEG